MRARAFVIPFLALAAAVTCGSPVDPESVRGTWYLHTYNDSPVPGSAVFRTASDSGVIVIDSVRLHLGTEGDCGWLVDLRTDPAQNATTCEWSLRAGPDGLVVTVDGGFVLLGDAMPAALSLGDPNGNRLWFERDPAVEQPAVPQPNRAPRGPASAARRTDRGT